MADLPGPEKPLGIDWGRLRKPITAVQAQTPKRVRARHRLIVMLHEAGWRNKDIARTLGYTESRVSIILGSRHPGLLEVREKFASEVADNIRDVHTRFRLYANEMVNIMVTHARQTADPALSRLAARDMLHMAGFTPVKKEFLVSAQLPVEELQKVLGKLGEANEVLERYGHWTVRSPEEKDTAA